MEITPFSNHANQTMGSWELKSKTVCYEQLHLEMQC